MEAKKHIDLIDIIKGVAIISVLICHSVIVYPVNLEEVAWCNILKRFVEFLSDAAVLYDIRLFVFV